MAKANETVAECSPPVNETLTLCELETKFRILKSPRHISYLDWVLFILKTFGRTHLSASGATQRQASAT